MKLMKVIVIYDATGKVWNIIYGEDTLPQGIPAIFVDIPDGAQLNRIDTTDSNNPKPIFIYAPDTDIGNLQVRVSQLEEELTNTQLALIEQYEENLTLHEEVTNTQLALVELYESNRSNVGKEV